MPLKVIVQLDIAVPDAITTPTLVEDVIAELRGALDVGVTDDYAPFLAESAITVARAHEQYEEANPLDALSGQASAALATLIEAALEEPQDSPLAGNYGDTDEVPAQILGELRAFLPYLEHRLAETRTDDELRAEHPRPIGAAANGEFRRALERKRTAAERRARNETYPPGARERFSLRQEVYEELLELLDHATTTKETN